MHFHAGIDISTGDVTGYKVFAMRDGFVRRIRIYPNGYGKILFVQHADGYTTAYAHLSRFAADLERRVEREQSRLGQYPIDLDFSPQEFPVKKGDVIAFTGDTGIGTPHLHIEIRDPQQEPINPLLCPNLHAPDHVAPAMAKLAVIPLEELPQGAAEEKTRVFSLRRRAPGAYTLPHPILVTERSGFAIDTHDPTDDGRFHRGVYRIRLLIDGMLWMDCVHDRAPLRYAQLVGAAYDWNLVDQRTGRFEKLYEEIPGALPFYRPARTGGGTVGPGLLAPGPHHLKIISEDFVGNKADLDGTLIIARVPMLVADRQGDSVAVHIPDPSAVNHLEEELLSVSGRWTRRSLPLSGKGDRRDLTVVLPRSGYEAAKISAVGRSGERSIPRIFCLEVPHILPARLTVSFATANDILRINVRCQGIFTISPTANLEEGGSTRSCPLYPDDVDAYQGSIHLNPETAGVRRIVVRAEVNGSTATATDSIALYPILPGTNGTYAFDDGRLEVQYDSEAVFSPLFLQVQKINGGEEPSYAFSPRLTILRDGLRVRLRSDSSPEHSALYFRNRSALHFLEKRSAGDGGVLQGRLTQTLGMLSVRTDEAPPSISRLSVNVPGHRSVVIRFRIRDNLSGVEYESVKLYIDSTPVIPDIDGEHRRVQYQSSAPLERGSHRLLIRCSDRAGNSRTVERQFTVR